MKKLTLVAISFALLMTTGIARAADWSGKTIKLGVDPTFPPMEVKTPDGKYAGFIIDVTEAVCAELRANCVWVESSWDAMIPALKARKFDVVASSMLITEKRKEQIAFSDVITVGPAALVVKRGNEVEPTAEGLKGKRVGIDQGSAQETYAIDKWQPFGVEIVPYQNSQLMNADLIAGRIDAAFESQVGASEGIMKQPEGKDLVFSGEAIGEEKYFGIGDGYGFRKEDTELLADVNRALATVIENGTFKKLNDKYFTFDIRKR